MEPKEEMPSMLWGLDPIFSAYARLYIRDILQMTESTQVPGDTKKIGGAQGGFDPVAEMRKLQRAQQNRCHVEIGELLRVRGPVKTTRQQREISASVFYKVDDPLMAVQISWMMEVPELYRQCYDKPLQLQSNNTSNASVSSTSKAVNIIRDFLNQKSVAKFRPYDVQELLQPLILNQLKATPGDQEPVAGPSGCQQLRQLLKEALQTLQDEGFIYRKVKSQDEVYSVTGQDKELVIAVKDVIREDSKREKYAEKGCHVLHILSAVRQRYSLNLSKAALELVLKSLECNSDIISCSDTHYTIL
ncbi:CST complex subunit STN1 isoform X2 [Boleophthalmus pectinirostris]|uniref:CST complex subunit STN1 isoform X2 n=1 Tax=Boleophthalmus pectinirostris TaxID=150288 RepID=UPI002432E44E|nr:CST complex subunit STN1 isoform X2 [Boleophthalmus pectinirostris]